LAYGELTKTSKNRPAGFWNPRSFKLVRVSRSNDQILSPGDGRPKGKRRIVLALRNMEQQRL